MGDLLAPPLRSPRSATTPLPAAPDRRTAGRGHGGAQLAVIGRVTSERTVNTGSPVASQTSTEIDPRPRTRRACTQSQRRRHGATPTPAKRQSRLGFAFGSFDGQPEGMQHWRPTPPDASPFSVDAPCRPSLGLVSRTVFAARSPLHSRCGHNRARPTAHVRDIHTSAPSGGHTTNPSAPQRQPISAFSAFSNQPWD